MYSSSCSQNHDSVMFSFLFSYPNCKKIILVSEKPTNWLPNIIWQQYSLILVVKDFVEKDTTAFENWIRIFDFGNDTIEADALTNKPKFVSSEKEILKMLLSNDLFVEMESLLAHYNKSYLKQSLWKQDKDNDEEMRHRLFCRNTPQDLAEKRRKFEKIMKIFKNKPQRYPPDTDYGETVGDVKTEWWPESRMHEYPNPHDSDDVEEYKPSRGSGSRKKKSSTSKSSKKKRASKNKQTQSRSFGSDTEDEGRVTHSSSKSSRRQTATTGSRTHAKQSSSPPDSVIAPSSSSSTRNEKPKPKPQQRKSFAKRTSTPKKLSKSKSLTPSKLKTKSKTASNPPTSKIFPKHEPRVAATFLNFLLQLLLHHKLFHLLYLHLLQLQINVTEPDQLSNKLLQKETETQQLTPSNLKKMEQPKQNQAKHGKV